MLLMKDSVLSMREKTTQQCFFYFQIAIKYSKSFMTDPLNIVFGTISVYDY